jgi:WD40 repeat protein
LRVSRQKLEYEPSIDDDTMADVFLSYARADKAFVTRLYGALAEAKRDVWVDWEDIPPTAQWLDEIKAAIDAADAVIFVASTTSIASQTCAVEVSHAAERHKRLIPVVIEQLDPKAVPPEVGKVQWVFCRPEDNFDAAMAEVLRAIDFDIEWVRAHTRLLTRALEWQSKGRDASLLLRGTDLRRAEEALLAATDRDPTPVPVQHDYVTASRRDANTRQRRLVGALAVGLVTTTGLAVAAWLQRQEAVAQRDEAVRQRTMVLGRQLAAQSELLRTQSANLLDRSVLLAVEAAARASGLDIDRALRASVGILPRLLHEHRHAEPVNAVAISADGQRVAAGGGDGVLRAWESVTGTQLAEINHGAPIRAVLFSPDGAQLASAGRAGVFLHAFSPPRDLKLDFGSAGVLAYGGTLVAAGGEDGRVTVWESSTGEAVATFAGGSEIFAVAISADGRLLAAGADNNIVRVWDIREQREIMRAQHEAASASMPLRLGSRDGGVFAVAFDDAGEYVVSGAQDRAVRVHDVASGREVFRAYQSDAVYSVAFSPDRRWLASGGMDETARVWNLEDGSERYRLQHQYVVQKVFWSRDGNLVTASGDGTARVWTVSTGTELARMFDPGYVYDAALATDGVNAVTGSWSGLVRVWELAGGGAAVLRLPHADARDARYSPTGKHVVTVGQTDFAQLWTVPDGKPTHRFQHAPFVSTAEFSPDGTKIVTTGWDGMVRLWDVGSGSELGSVAHQGRVVDAQFSSDGRVIATAGFEDGTAIVIDAATGRERLRLTHEGSSRPRPGRGRPMPAGVRCLAFRPDQNAVATGGQDGTVRLWDLADGRELQRFPHEGYILDAVFTPDGQYLLTDADNEICVWSVSGGSRVERIDKTAEKDEFMSVLGMSPDGRLALVANSEQNSVQVRAMPELNVIATLLHDDDVFWAAFDKAGTRLLTASRDKTARVWDARNWQETARVTANDFVYRASFSPDERFFLTASGDGLAQIFAADTSAMVETACQRLKRSLSAEEWRQYIGSGAPTSSCAR